MLHYSNKKLLVILLLFSGSVLFGQITSRKDKRLLFKANSLFDYGDYPSALEMYEKLLPLDSSSAELNYKIAVCKFENRKTREQSRKFFYKTDPTLYP